jgi:hypothetical protein
MEEQGHRELLDSSEIDCFAQAIGFSERISVRILPPECNPFFHVTKRREFSQEQFDELHDACGWA